MTYGDSKLGMGERDSGRVNCFVEAIIFKPVGSNQPSATLLLHSRAASSKQRSLKPLRSCHPQECIGEDFVRGECFPHEMLPFT